MDIVSENPNFYINNYSKEFEKDYLDILKRNYRSNWVSANKIYQDYISDKNSTHMNSTRWSTLTGFIKHLESIGKIELQEEINDKNIIEVKIKYIEKTHNIVKERDKIKNRKNEKLFYEKFKEKKLLERIERDRENEMKILKERIEKNNKELNNNNILNINEKNNKNNTLDNDNKIEILLNFKEKQKKNFLIGKKLISNVESEKSKDIGLNKDKFEMQSKLRKESQEKDSIRNFMENFCKTNNKYIFDQENKFDYRSNKESNFNENNKNEINLLKKKIKRDNLNSDYQEILQIKSTKVSDKEVNSLKDSSSEEKETIIKEFFDKEDPWIKKNLLVRIKDRNLSNGEYYDLKGLIQNVFDSYLAEVKILETNIVLRIDQEFLEPIIPKLNSHVEILYGKNKGKIGILKQVYENTKTALLETSIDNIDEIFHVYLNGICKVFCNEENYILNHESFL